MIILPTYPESDWPIGSSGGASLVRKRSAMRRKFCIRSNLERHADRLTSINS